MKRCLRRKWKGYGAVWRNILTARTKENTSQTLVQRILIKSCEPHTIWRSAVWSSESKSESSSPGSRVKSILKDISTATNTFKLQPTFGWSHTSCDCSIYSHNIFRAVCDITLPRPNMTNHSNQMRLTSSKSIYDSSMRWGNILCFVLFFYIIWSLLFWCSVSCTREQPGWSRREGGRGPEVIFDSVELLFVSLASKKRNFN